MPPYFLKIRVADAEDCQVYCKKQCDISGTEQGDVHCCFSGREQPQEDQEENCQNKDRGEDLFHGGAFGIRKLGIIFYKNNGGG